MSRDNKLPDNDKPHLSTSSCNMYCRCGESWRRRYVEGDKSPPVMAIMKGKSVHAAIALNMSQKIRTHEDMVKSDVVDKAVSELTDECKQSFELSESEQRIGKDETINQAEISVRGLVDAHMDVQAPNYQPEKVETGFRIELDACSHDFVGYKDMVGHVSDRAIEFNGERVIVDWKTSKRRPQKGTEHESIQLTAYAADELTDADDNIMVRIDTLVDRPKTYPNVVQTSWRDASDVRALAHRVNTISVAIDANIFPPALPGSWWCSKNWCGYWDTCPYVNATRESKSKELYQIEKAMSALLVDDEVNMNKESDDDKEN